MIYLFSNTLWFLVNFKKELIEALLKKYDVTLFVHVLIDPVIDLRPSFSGSCSY